MRLMDNSAQVSVEYLFILAGVLAVLGMIAYLVFSSTGTKLEEINESTSVLNEAISNL